MRKYLLNLTLVLFLGLNGVVFAREVNPVRKNSSHAAGLSNGVNNKVEKVKAQIHILNLLNGLELTKDQMQLILDATGQAEIIRQKYKELIIQKENQVSSAYSEVLAVAKTGTVVVPKEIAFRVHRINEEVDKIKERAQEELTSLVTKIKDNLEPHQLYVLDDYKPCIIPPVKQGRIGQADDPQGFVKILEKVHSLPDNRYNLRKNEIAQRAIDRVKSKVPAGFILDAEKLKSKLLKAMEEVRQMSEVDFALKKEEIAREIKTNLSPQRPPMNIGVKIERFLLQPEIIPFLEERLTSSKN